MFTFYEFFAGGGMARAGLGSGWECLFANDFNPMKEATYRSQPWDHSHFLGGDIAKVKATDLKGMADLAWASFPCQDLSLAGDYRGLGTATDEERTRSGTFWPFWALMKSLRKQGRAPRVIVLENVYGVLTSNKGQDFNAICEALAAEKYRFGCVVMDAQHFVPQSRPRVFFVCVQGAAPTHSSDPSPIWHPPAVMKAWEGLSPSLKKRWVWWDMPAPPKRNTRFTDLIEDNPTGVQWHSKEETSRLIGMMSQTNLAKLENAKKSGNRMVGGVYKRTRIENGQKRQRAEIRFDEVSGCLRTPGGGSSRQTIVMVKGEKVRSRLLSTREAARLMGLDDNYILPERYNDAYHVAGDGVVVPVVRYLAANILEPQLRTMKVVEASRIAAE